MDWKWRVRVLLAGVLAGATPWAVSQIAQEPLLNRLNSVAPNLMLVLDTSGSMDIASIYEYGNPSSTGPTGPGSTYGATSPDVNKLYYDPRVRYYPRVAYDGTPLAEDIPGTGSTHNRWDVYFRINPGQPYSAGGDTLANYYNPYQPHLVAPASVVPGSTAAYPPNIDIRIMPSTVRLPKFVNRTDCVTHADACTPHEERANYMRWRKWYQDRAKMAETALGLALQPVVGDSIRLGWATIWQLYNDGTLSAGVSSFGNGSGGGKDRFLNWLYSRTYSDGTPNKWAVARAGNYYRRADSDGPWATTPNPASLTVASPPGGATGPGALEPPASHASCRRSFTLLVTDGYWNIGGPTNFQNFDDTAISIPAEVGPPYTQAPVAPYRDSHSNTLADIAMYYWGTDLRPDLPNRVPTVQTAAGLNPSTWQNSSFYAVTLGLLGTLPRTATVTSELYSGARSWPNPVSNTPTTIDDTWHATINGRGELINARNAQELTDAITRILTSVAGTPQTQSGVAVSAIFLRNGTRKYKPEYVPGLWTGRLSAVELDASTGNERNPRLVHWEVERGTDVNGDPISTIPAHDARNIATWSGSSGIYFNAAATGLTASLVDYIRGDSSLEIRKGGTMRDRTARLGDIVNANPVYVRDNVDLRYDTLGLGNYRDFIATKMARPGVLFVGANDGMLHAFRDSDGVETFAYVPKAVWPNLHRLAEPRPAFRHRYFVDGPQTETDAYLGGYWRNLLLGSTGAGARAVYALDVTDSNNMQPGNVLWEVSDATPGFSNLGHVLSDVQTGVTVNGRWIAVFGNGFGSASGNAGFFVVDLHTGQLLRELTPHTGPGNGMGGVRLVFDGNRRVVGGYAGDLLGNLWKLDLTGDPADWRVGLGGVPLYTAGSGQPITAPPTVVPHPDRGHVVVFGTGKFFETGDAAPPYNPQRLYGIWDAQPFGAASTPPGAALSGTGRLVLRTIATTNIGQAQYFTVSSGAVAWGDGAGIGLRGWYLDLPNAGQRVIHPLEPLAGTFLLASTISPESAAPPDVCVATGSGSGWVYIIDGVTGSGPTIATLDTNNDGLINDADVVVGGYRDVVDGRPTPITLQATASGTRLCIETAQSVCTQIRLQCGQLGASSCPVPPATGIKSRSWRQLHMR
ncbi:pilus assembly protein [Ramlibacter henchirensis]|nr:PilC/PilY family type IV pilus protein [Ramlibacter henchirensis]